MIKDRKAAANWMWIVVIVATLAVGLGITSLLPLPVSEQGDVRRRVSVSDELWNAMQERVAMLTRMIRSVQGSSTQQAEEAWKEYQRTMDGVNARLHPSLEEAAMMYSERKSASIHTRFRAVEEKVKHVLDCMRRSCSPEVKALALQEAEQALDDLDRAVEAFPQVYKGLLQAHSDTHVESQ